MPLPEPLPESNPPRLPEEPPPPKLQAVPGTQPPYGIIADRLRKGLVVPFLGAGASLIGRKGPWTQGNASTLPSAKELAEFLSDRSQCPPDGDNPMNLAKIASYCVEAGGRDDLQSCLREVLLQPFQYNGLHEMLAKIDAPLVIVVTNYDMLLEQAFLANGREFDLMIYMADGLEGEGESILWRPHGAERPEPIEEPNTFDVPFGQRPLIFKMHGTITEATDEWDSFVITEEDYVDFLVRMVKSTAIPAAFTPYFRTRSFLFLGYSLGDWNLRVILKNLSRTLSSRKGGGAPSWAIQLSPSELEKVLWKNRDVRIFGMDLAVFVTRMKERLGG